MQKTTIVIIIFGLFVLLLSMFVWKKDNGFFTTPIAKPIKQTNLYYGVNVDMSQLLPESRNYITNAKGEDFIDIASHLGIHMFRITAVGKSFDTKGDTLIYTRKQWDIVLDKMAAHGITAIVLIEANGTNQELNSSILTDRYLKLVKQIVIDPDLGSYNNVYAIDLRNEPILSVENIEKLEQAAHIIKTKYPQMRV